MTVAALLPKSPPPEDGTGVEDAFGVSNMLGTLGWTGCVAFCFGFDDEAGPELNKPPPVSDLLEVEAGICPVMPFFGESVLDPEDSIGAGCGFAVAGVEPTGAGAAGLEADAGSVADLEAIEGPGGLTTDLVGRTVFLLLVCPRHSYVSHTVGNSRLVLPTRG